MKTEDDRTVDDHGKGDHDARFGVEDAPMTDVDGDTPSHSDIPMPPGPDLVLDERLTSAAAPFLYLLSVILIAVAGYFVYLFFYG